MDSVIRALATYAFLLLVFRVAGKRSLAEMSSFELVILLIISETTQQAMVDDDHSMTNAAIAILTLVGAGIVMTVLKERFPIFQRAIAGAPLLLIENGEIMHERLKHARIGVDEIMAAARLNHGLERVADIKHALLEAGGGISIIPKRQ
jgi:uncharacterized membrane protein YcaP (DUF421 family)